MEVKFYKRVSSTNSLAKKRKFPIWTVVVAEAQRSGRGKGKRKWFSPKGGLYFTVILPPKPPTLLPYLNLVGGIAVAKALEQYGVSPSIKWPNDVLIKGRKVAGVLSENIISSKTEFSLIGIGLNTNIKRFPLRLEKKATSLLLEGKKVENNKILPAIFNNLKKMVDLKGEEILKEYKRYASKEGV